MNPPYDPDQPSSPEARRRAFRLLFLCLMATSVGNSMLFAILPPLARELEVREVYIGAIYTLSALLFLTMSPLWGALSDRYGRRPLIVFGLSWFSFSTLVFGAGAWAGQSGLLPPMAAIFAMALSRSLFGGLGSATNPAAQAYVADRTSPAERTEALAGLTAAFGLGSVIGPALADAFVGRIGVAPFMLLVSVAVAGGAVAVRFLLPERTPPRRKGRPINPLKQFRFAGDPRVTAFVLFGVTTWLCQASSLQTIGFFVIDRAGGGDLAAAPALGIVLSSGAAALLIAQLVVIPALKASPRFIMTLGAALAAAGNLELVFADSYAAIVFGFIVTSLGFGLARSGFTGGASLAVLPEEQGRAAGMTTATAGVGFMIAPLLGLYLYQSVGPFSPFALNAALSLAGLSIAVLHPRVRAVATPVAPDPDDPARG